MARGPRKPHPRSKIASQRIRAGYTQQRLSELTGIPIRSLQRLERGETSEPSLRHLVNIAMALHVRLEDVLEDEWTEWKVYDQRAKEPPPAPGSDW